MLEATSQPIRLLIIDDHALLRAGLRMLLESQEGLVVVGETDNCLEAEQLTTREQPDIILLDLDLHGEIAVDCIPALLAAAQRARVIVLTGVQDAELHRRAVHLGAVGLVLKHKAYAVLLKAIACVQAGEVWLERTMMAHVLMRLTRTDAPDPEADKIATLTEREREVIMLIGEGIKNQQIAERLCISRVTVGHHLSSIFDKLGVSDRLALVIYAYRHGLIQIS
jgi:DNA-binding NarL/FixJ family response regulator